MREPMPVPPRAAPMAAPSALAHTTPARPGWRGTTVWLAYALMLALAPLVFRSDFSITLLSQVGIAIVACLSFNMLLGQGGMLSFGHAVYTGLGAYASIHALKAIGDGVLPVPVLLLPLVGGVAGLFFAVLLGYVTTRKSGTTFAMITLGLSELVFAMSLMVPEFFGGEAGVAANRVVGMPLFGIGFGPQIRVYWLLAIYTFACTAAMYAFTQTPLGRMLNAVRDNPERVAYVGYDTQRVRYIAFVIAGFFAGVAGGMYALSFEIATAEVVGAARSGAYLLFTFLGGATYFFGPIIGAVLMVLAMAVLSEFTKAWLLYLGLVFLFMVMQAPGGIASLLMMNLRLAAFGRLKALLPWHAALGAALLVVLAGAAALIEMTYHLQLAGASGTPLQFLGLSLDSAAPATWIGAAAVLAAGLALFVPLQRRFALRWDEAQAAIERELQRRERA